MHVYSEINSTVFNGAYSQLSVHLGRNARFSWWFDWAGEA